MAAYGPPFLKTWIPLHPPGAGSARPNCELAKPDKPVTPIPRSTRLAACIIEALHITPIRHLSHSRRATVGIPARSDLMPSRIVNSRFDMQWEHFGHDEVPQHLATNYNITPSQEVQAVRVADGRRVMVPLHWGLIPSWAKDVKTSYRMINARAETVADKLAYRTAFRERRCLVPADGYYEWVRHEVAYVIVWQSHLTRPAVPSAVPYEVGRIGNKPSKSPRTMYLPPQGGHPTRERTMALSASRRLGARVNGMVSESEPQ